MPLSEALDAGEGAAIALAIELHADLLLMDDEEGVSAARGKGLAVTGTLGGSESGGAAPSCESCGGF
jgi:predicted nucleic acid-binding protein